MIKDFTYDGQLVSFDVHDQDDIMINATQLAKIYGKRPNDWFNLPSTVSFLKVLSNTRKSGNSDYQAIITKSGAPETGGGTWIHRTAALEFARWLDPKFAIWCNERILELIQTGVSAISDEAIIAQGYILLQKKLAEINKEKTDLTEQNKVLKQQVQETEKANEFYNMSKRFFQPDPINKPALPAKKQLKW